MIIEWLVSVFRDDKAISNLGAEGITHHRSKKTPHTPIGVSSIACGVFLGYIHGIRKAVDTARLEVQSTFTCKLTFTRSFEPVHWNAPIGRSIVSALLASGPPEQWLLILVIMGVSQLIFNLGHLIISSRNGTI